MVKPALVILSCSVALLVLTGCESVAQSRYQPTSVEEVFGSFARVGGVDGDVYELPAYPPALGGAEGQRRSCRPPGVVMKPTDMVGVRDDHEHTTTREPTPLVAMQEPPMRSPGPGPAYRLASWQQHLEPGAKERISTPPYSPRLEPGRSMQPAEPRLIGAYRRDVWSWCYEGANLR